MEMALGKICRTSSLKFNHGVANGGEESGLRRFVRCDSGLGRKRIEISKEIEEFSPIDTPTKVPLLKRHCSERIKKMMMIDDRDEKSVLESLPQDVLVSPTQNPKFGCFTTMGFVYSFIHLVCCRLR